MPAGSTVCNNQKKTSTSREHLPVRRAKQRWSQSPAGVGGRTNARCVPLLPALSVARHAACELRERASDRAEILQGGILPIHESSGEEKEEQLVEQMPGRRRDVVRHLAVHAARHGSRKETADAPCTQAFTHKSTAPRTQAIACMSKAPCTQAHFTHFTHSLYRLTLLTHSLYSREYGAAHTGHYSHEYGALHTGHYSHEYGAWHIRYTVPECTCHAVPRAPSLRPLVLSQHPICP